MFRLHSIERDTASRQQGVAADEIGAIVRRAFGRDARPELATELGSGTINSTYRLDVAGEDSYILRVGPTRDATERGPSWLPAETLRREHALTPYFAPIAPLVPKPVVADFTHQILDRDWVIQSTVPGRPWAELDGELPAGERASLWRQLGTITRAIHSVTGERFGPLSPGRSFARWSDLLAHDCAGIAADFARFGLPGDAPRQLEALVGENAAVLDAAGPPRLIHSDLDRRHVFVLRDEDGVPVVSGIIDHEFGRFADPLSESLLLMLRDLPEADPFLVAYGPLPDDEAARWRARIYQAIALGWTAGDLAHRGQGTAETVARFAQRVRALADGRW